MKHHLAAILILATFMVPLRAGEEQRRAAPPTEIPDFSNLDEFVRIPTSTVTLGFRILGGVKATFAGQGLVSTADDPGPATGSNLLRVYHDGRVRPDARTTPRLDSGGNIILDPAGSQPVFDPIAPDGRTDSWNFTDVGQLTDSGLIAFHNYSAEVIDTGVRQHDARSAVGMELVTMHDMGQLLGTRMTWQLTAGMSVSDISTNSVDLVEARLTTLTDYYPLFGQVPQEAPYTAPSSISDNVLDASGNPLFNDDGTNQTVQTDTTVLLVNEPLGRTTETIIDETTVSNRWRLRGAYFTLRAGPTVWIPITTRLKASVSVGAALIYSGTAYTVTQQIQPEFGDEITDSIQDESYKLLPGYYFDASLQFEITERAGLFAGAVYQSAGSYQQVVEGEASRYETDIDFSNQSGLRAGMSIRF